MFKSLKKYSYKTKSFRLQHNREKKDINRLQDLKEDQENYQ
jgi:hypothetical protein